MKQAGPIAFAVILSGAGGARAQELEIERPMPQPAEMKTALADGAMLPSTLAPRVGMNAAVALGFAGYDGARSAPIASATAEVRLWGPLALRGGVEYSSTRKEERPTIGARVQLLHQEHHGIDGAVSVFYRPEGFTEAEGEIESCLSVGRRFDRVSLFGNLVYGQDPEGNERDGEIRLAALYGAGRWSFGVDSRLRFALRTPTGATAAAEPRADLLAGPVAAASLGRIALFAQVGPSVLRSASNSAVGVAAFAGLGSLF